MKISLNTNHPLVAPIATFAGSLRDIVLDGDEIFDIFVSNDIEAITRHVQQRLSYPNHQVIRARTLVVCNRFEQKMHDLCSNPEHDVYLYIAPTQEKLEYEIAAEVVDMVVAGGLPYVHIRSFTNNIPLVQKHDMFVDTQRLIQELKPFMNTNQPTQLCINSSSGNDLQEGAGHYKGLQSEIESGRFLNQQFRGGYVEEVYNNLKQFFKFGRVRLMRIEPKTNYSFHADFTPRLHIPLITNNQSFLLVGGKRLHLPVADHPYIVNTRLVHTAINGHTDQSRYHLVFVLLS